MPSMVRRGSLAVVRFGDGYAAPNRTNGRTATRVRAGGLLAVQSVTCVPSRVRVWISWLCIRGSIWLDQGQKASVRIPYTDRWSWVHASVFSLAGCGLRAA